jgi:competence protein ComEC
LVLVTLAFALGIALGDAAGLSGAEPGVALAALGLAAVGALALAAAWARERLVGTAALVCALGLGVLAQAPRPRAHPALVDGEPITLRGRVREGPVRLARNDDGLGVATRVRVALEEAERDGVAWPVHGGLDVILGGAPREPLAPGDAVQIRGAPRAPRGHLNPGAPDVERRAAADGIVARVALRDPAALSRLALAPRPALDDDGLVARGWMHVERALLALRRGGLARIDRVLPARDAALVGALALGERGRVERTVEEEFRRAGVTHVLSVSGLHLALVTWLLYEGLAWLLVRVPRLGRGRPARRFAATVALPAAIAYAVMTGAEPATLRALGVAAVYLGGVALGRRPRLPEALACAALGILLEAPLRLFDPSLQLSFAAAIACAALVPRLPRGDEQGLARRAFGALLVGLARRAAALTAVSAAALLGTMPLTALHFAELQPAGLVTNLVVVPLAELALLPLALVGVTLGAVWSGAGDALLLVAGFIASLLGDLVAWVAAWAPAPRLPAPGVGEVLLFLGGLALVRLGLGPDGTRRARRLGAALVVVAALVFGGRALALRTSRALEIVFCDIGQGDAAVLFLPEGRVAVIDGGGSMDPAWDPGRELIAPLLRRRGVQRIDLVVLSHPHPDHANGLAALVDAFEVGEVWTNGAESAQPGTVRLLEAAARRGVPVRRPRRLELAGARFEPHGPRGFDGRLALDEALSENDNSIVLELTFAGRRVLFPGDAEREAEARLVAAGLPRVDVLKVPHHGSRTSSSAALLDATRPAIAVASLGDRNRFRFPHPEVVARYAAARIPLYRTDRDGAVTLTISPKGDLAIATARGTILPR